MLRLDHMNYSGLVTVTSLGGGGGGGSSFILFVISFLY